MTPPPGRRSRQADPVTFRGESAVYVEGPWSHRAVSANGTRLHVAESGDGPLVLLLHGFPEFWWTWREQLATLAAAGYRAVAPDLRGYGGSDKPPRGYDLVTAASDAAGLVRALGEANAVVVGHDWGGLVAWTMAAYYPKVVRRLARHLDGAPAADAVLDRHRPAGPGPPQRLRVRLPGARAPRAQPGPGSRPAGRARCCVPGPGRAGRTRKPSGATGPRCASPRWPIRRWSTTAGSSAPGSARTASATPSGCAPPSRPPPCTCRARWTPACCPPPRAAPGGTLTARTAGACSTGRPLPARGAAGALRPRAPRLAGGPRT